MKKKIYSLEMRSEGNALPIQFHSVTFNQNNPTTVEVSAFSYGLKYPWGPLFRKLACFTETSILYVVRFFEK